MHHHPPQATHLALADIAHYLPSQGATLAQCGLPELQHRDSDVDLERSFFCDQLPILRQRSDDAHASMNADQQGIFDRILNHRDTGGCFFVDGRAGRGKTFLVGAICNRVRGEGDIVCVTGTTALSVIHYDRGRTAHSAFGIPVQDHRPLGPR